MIVFFSSKMVKRFLDSCHSAFDSPQMSMQFVLNVLDQWPVEIRLQSVVRLCIIDRI